MRRRQSRSHRCVLPLLLLLRVDAQGVDLGMSGGGAPGRLPDTQALKIVMSGVPTIQISVGPSGSAEPPAGLAAASTAATQSTPAAVPAAETASTGLAADAAAPPPGWRESLMDLLADPLGLTPLLMLCMMSVFVFYVMKYLEGWNVLLRDCVVALEDRAKQAGS